MYLLMWLICLGGGVINHKYKNKTPRAILSELTLRQKVAQTIVPAYGDYEKGREAVKNGVGGVWPIIHFSRNSTAAEFAADIGELQEMSEIPLFINADMETGPGQLIHDGTCTEFPEPMAYSAIPDISEAAALAYEQGKAMAEEAMALGWNMTPTPVVDVNVSAYNPITNIRSCGDDAERVTRVMCAMIDGMQAGGIIPMAKHFPGAGMQACDSHFDMERIGLTRGEMRLHLAPFEEAIRRGVRCIMTNHAIYEAYDPVNVSTLSKAVMTDLLRGELGYKNLVMTDAMGMQGVSEQGKGADAAIKALQAGNDLLLAPGGETDNIIDEIVFAVEKGALPAEAVDSACLRILEGKAWLGLFGEKQRIYPMPDGSNRRLAERIARKSVTVIRDMDGLLPVDRKKKILVIEPAHPRKMLDFGLYTNSAAIYDDIKAEFCNAKFTLFGANADTDSARELARRAALADLVIAGASFRSYAGQVGLLTRRQVDALRVVAEANPNVVAVTANPYAASEIPFIRTVLCCYSTSKAATEAAVAVIAGRRGAEGVLSIRLPESFDTSKVQVLSHD